MECLPAAGKRSVVMTADATSRFDSETSRKTTLPAARSLSAFSAWQKTPRGSWPPERKNPGGLLLSKRLVAVRGHDDRPLAGRWEALHQDELPLYGRAHFAIATDGLTPEQVARRILEVL